MLLLVCFSLYAALALGPPGLPSSLVNTLPLRYILTFLPVQVRSKEQTDLSWQHQEKPTLLTPRCWASGLQNHESINAYG
ncbi:rCG20097 [Rattus norvegicus]|uniref:RCG20097 n=1 Tax=Rattus norvegicus TaxID=10116 RepID=A6JGB9_RAT|nr:rCG20097 [Rattus norvegicus]